MIQKYSSFIEKLMKDKKDLSLKCEHYSQKLLEKENEFSRYKALAQEQIHKIKDESLKNLRIAIEPNKNRKELKKIYLFFINKEENEEEIQILKAENSEMKKNHDIEIETLKSQAHNEFLEFEARIKDTITKKVRLLIFKD